MADSSSLHKLALLPKIDPAERTLSHVKTQRAYTKYYALEGRAYMSSWRDEYEGHIAKSSEKTVTKEKAVIDLDTPVLKPRVAQVSKSVITSCSSKSGKEERAKKAEKTQIVPLNTIKVKKRRNDEQGADKGGRREISVEQSKRTRKKPQSKKKRSLSLSDNSSAAERLKKRRERKRAKRAVINSSSSADNENVAEKRSDRRKGKENKKMPIGFALMHGFTAPNIGKNRLTVKPSVNIGVFNRGKASAKTVAIKPKASKIKGHGEGYFSESKFLNNARAVSEEDESSCVSISTSSSGVAAKECSKKESRKTKAGDASTEVSNIRIFPTPSIPQKQPTASSIVWDIELGKSLCSDDTPMSTTPADKLGSVILDVTRHSWAKLLDTADPNQNTDSVVTKPRPNTNSTGESEVPTSISPSQSASQLVKEAIAPRKEEPQGERRSQYFRSGPKKTQYETCAEYTSPPLVHQDDRNYAPVSGEYERLAQGADYGFLPTESPKDGSRSAQRGTSCDCQMKRGTSAAVIAPIDTPNQEPEFHLGTENVDDLIWTGTEHINCFYDTFGEYDCLQDGEIPVLEQDLFIQENGIMAWDRGPESACNLSQDFDFSDLVQGRSYHDYCITVAADDSMDIDERYDHDFIQEGHEEAHRSYAEQAIGFDQNEDNETSSQGFFESIEDMQQIHRFFQGRALLSGCSMQEIGQSSKTPTRYPRLSLLEADVAKSLRDHWHPQRL